MGKKFKLEIWHIILGVVLLGLFMGGRQATVDYQAYDSTWGCYNTHASNAGGSQKDVVTYQGTRYTDKCISDTQYREYQCFGDTYSSSVKTCPSTRPTCDDSVAIHSDMCVTNGGGGGGGPVCGNGVCESGETSSSCSADCGTGGGGSNLCGNNIEDAGENCDTCPEDVRPSNIICPTTEVWTACTDGTCCYEGLGEESIYGTSCCYDKGTGSTANSYVSQQLDISSQQACLNAVNPNLCGNGVKDPAEDCNSCSQDVKCTGTQDCVESPTGNYWLCADEVTLYYCDSSDVCKATSAYYAKSACDSDKGECYYYNNCGNQCSSGGGGPVCDNGVCESGETASSCPADCDNGGGGGTSSTCAKEGEYTFHSGDITGDSIVAKIGLQITTWIADLLNIDSRLDYPDHCCEGLSEKALTKSSSGWSKLKATLTGDVLEILQQNLDQGKTIGVYECYEPSPIFKFFGNLPELIGDPTLDMILWIFILMMGLSMVMSMMPR